MLSVIFPSYNEAARLPKLLRELENFHAKQDAKQNTSFEFLIVDDGSTDNSIEVIKDFQKKRPHLPLRLIQAPQNAGKGAAVGLGDTEARGEYRAFLDVDLSTPLEVLPPALERMQNEPSASLLIGSRHAPGAQLEKRQGFLRYLLGRSFSFFTSLWHESAFSDTQCGFKMWSKGFSELVISNIKAKRWSFDVEWILHAEKHNLGILELPVPWHDESGSKVSALRDGRGCTALPFAAWVQI